MRTTFYFMLFATQFWVPSTLFAGEELLEQLKTLEQQAGELSIKKEADCFKAIGNRGYCSCLRRESPVGLSFLEYVAVLTATNAKVLPDLTYEENRKMAESAAVARTKCAENLR